MNHRNGWAVLCAVSLLAACGSVDERSATRAAEREAVEAAGVPAAPAAPAAPEAPGVPAAPDLPEIPAVPAATTPAADVVDPAPEFRLPGVDGRTYALSDFRGKVVVLEWTNHGCPFVIKHYGAGNMQRLQKEYTARGIVWLSICSSAPGKQGHMDAAAWRKTNERLGVGATAVLIDEDGKVGRMYGAKVTPHMFVVGADGGVLYRGAIDDKPSPNPADIPGAKNHVAAMLDAALGGGPVERAETRPYG